MLATVLFFGSLLLGLLVVITVPRLLRLFVRPDRDYRLYGIRYWIHRDDRPDDQPASSSPGSSATAPSSCTTCAASDTTCPKVEQTGSNFGTDVKHDNPFLSTVGSGTVVADGLSIVNADYSNTHFRVSRVAIGAHNFLGNRIAYPAQGRTGDNCLLATKVMVPLDGPVREGVGLLGSPSFEIPRTVDRDNQLDVTEPGGAAPPAVGQEPAQHGHHPAVPAVPLDATSALLTVLALATVDLYSEFGVLGRRAGRPADAAADRALLRAARPAGAGPAGAPAERLLDLRPRLLAARAVLEDLRRRLHAALQRHPVQERDLAHCWGARSAAGCSTTAASFTERSFVTIGDHCTLNAGSDHPVPLPGGRRVQVRPHRDRRREHARGQRLRALRRDDRDRRAARTRLVPDEGRGGPPASPGGAETRPWRSATAPDP